MRVSFKKILSLGYLVLFVAAGVIPAVGKTQAELELDRRAKQDREERARQKQAEEFQTTLAEAVKQGAKKFDWACVPIAESRDWKQQQAALLARYKDSRLIIDGMLGAVFNRGTPQASFLFYDPLHRGGRLLVLLRDLDDQKILAPAAKQLHIKIIGTMRDDSRGNVAAIIDAEAVGSAN